MLLECGRAFGGEQFVNAFWDYGRQKFLVGRFLTDADRFERNPMTGELRETPPWRRQQVIYGEGDSWEEACFFLKLGRPTWKGYRPKMNELGHVTAFKSPSGLHINRIPAPEGLA